MKEDHARAKNGAIPFYPGCPRGRGASARLTEIATGMVLIVLSLFFSSARVVCTEQSCQSG